jgi:hypothetical protein
MMMNNRPRAKSAVYFSPLVNKGKCRHVKKDFFARRVAKSAESADIRSTGRGIMLLQFTKDGENLPTQDDVSAVRGDGTPT